MVKIYQFDGERELEELLKRFTSRPNNTEIAEKTGISKSGVSRIMNKKIKPSKSFIEKFKKGFGIKDNDINVEFTPIEKEKPPSQDSGLKDKMIQLLESSLKRVEDELQRVLAENERLKNK